MAVLEVLCYVPFYILAIIVLIAWCIQRIMQVVAIFHGKRILHRKPSGSAVIASLPGVSILKPLTGTDANTMENFESFFTLAYPKFELIFCMEEEHESAISILRTLMEKYPHVDVRLIIAQRNVGVNPKINNMISGYELAKYDLILISDMGVKTKENTVSLMVENLTDDVGAVHQMPFVVDRAGFSGKLEKVYFGTDHAVCYLFTDATGINCLTGMSCLCRKKIIDEVGGLGFFGQYLAEDFILGETVRKKGYRARVCAQPVMQNPGTTSVENFNKRMARWAKLRLSVMPYMVLVEPLCVCSVMGVLSSWMVWSFFGWNPYFFFLGHVLSWLLLEYILLRIIQGGSLPFHVWEYAYLSLFRDLCLVYSILQVHLNPTVKWKGVEYVLQWRSVAKIKNNSNNNNNNNHKHPNW